MRKENNYAFIDGQNLYLALDELRWKLDYKKFRVYLKKNIELGGHICLWDFYRLIRNYIIFFKPLVLSLFLNPF